LREIADGGWVEGLASSPSDRALGRRGLEGQPANPQPVHICEDPDPDRAIAYANRFTACSRPIIVHRGSFYDGTHAIDDRRKCWCNPETIPPDERVSNTDCRRCPIV